MTLQYNNNNNNNKCVTSFEKKKKKVITLNFMVRAAEEKEAQGVRLSKTNTTILTLCGPGSAIRAHTTPSNPVVSMRHILRFQRPGGTKMAPSQVVPR